MTDTSFFLLGDKGIDMQDSRLGWPAGAGAESEVLV